ncbi:hypothetical protein AX17_006456 [Amanita inopinata Kibby_2008]|nr:hypothetical protein AX17_006456 [Amanita inopinata Kibby_2008]
MSSLLSTIETLHKREGMQFHNLEHHAAALAPHQRLLDDVLREIFIWCARAYGSILLNQIQKHTPQLVISHVCSRWRQVVLSTGELWSNVDVRVTKDTPLEALNIAENWLKRAGKFPVYLRLDIGTGPRLNHTAVFKRLCSDIRIACLDLFIQIHDLSQLSALPDDILQDIQEVRLVTDLFENAKPPPLPSFVRHTRFLFCTGHVAGSNLGAFESVLPWDQIRYLDIDGLHISMSQCLGLSRHMVSLEKCWLPVSELQDDNPAADQRSELTLPRLEILALWLYRGAAGALNNLVRVLRTPRLRKLSMVGVLVSLGVETITHFAARLNLHRLEEMELHQLKGR